MNENTKHGPTEARDPSRKRTPLCACGMHGIRCETFDRYYCPSSFVWLETPCTDPACEFCSAGAPADARGIERKRHVLKCWPEFYDAIAGGRKTFELRRDDRGFEVGDVLELRWWNPETESYYDGDSSDTNTLFARVSYVLRDAPNFGLAPGFAIMSFELVDEPVFEVAP